MKTSLICLLFLLPGMLLAQGVKQVPIRFSGGHDTYPEDHGRPVALIAAALKVSPDVFRAAFSGVHPAGPDSGGPTDAEARANKQVLMRALGPYGVTDDRLNAVSNYYRYNRSRGEMWPVVPATGYATVTNGVITGFTITNPGSGYTSAPTATVPGFDVKIITSIAYSTDFARNGAVTEMHVASATIP
jgi:hypothetical protein